MIKKNEWKFTMKHPKKGTKISSVIAKDFIAAKKQVDTRFPSDDGWIILSYAQPNGIVVEIHE